MDGQQLYLGWRWLN